MFVIVSPQLKIHPQQGKTHLLRRGFPKQPPSPAHPSSPLYVSLGFPASPSFTAPPARWLCCLSPGASWHLGALGAWRTARSSAVRTYHLRGWQEAGRELTGAMSEVEQRWKYSLLRRKASPTVAGAWGRAVWFVKPQFPRVCPSVSNKSSWWIKF